MLLARRTADQSLQETDMTAPLMLYKPERFYSLDRTTGLTFDPKYIRACRSPHACAFQECTSLHVWTALSVASKTISTCVEQLLICCRAVILSMLNTRVCDFFGLLRGFTRALDRFLTIRRNVPYERIVR